MILKMSSVSAGYGKVRVLNDFTLEVAPGEVHCIMGRNGAGKTTAMKTILGLVRTQGGMIHFKDERIDRKPAHRVPRRGIGYVPQGRRLFSELTVAENLETGRMTRRRPRATIERVIEMFPILGERLKQRAGTLSGGQQQMLATARALCLEPDLLILDEPSEGLQPSIVEAIHQTVRDLKSAGTTVLLVENRVEAVLDLADKISFVEHGTVAETQSRSDLSIGSAEFRRFVGIG